MAKEILLECAGMLKEHGWAPKPDFFNKDLSSFTITKAEVTSGKPKEPGFLVVQPDTFIRLVNPTRPTRLIVRPDSQ